MGRKRKGTSVKRSAHPARVRTRARARVRRVNVLRRWLNGNIVKSSAEQTKVLRNGLKCCAEGKCNTLKCCATLKVRCVSLLTNAPAEIRRKAQNSRQGRRTPMTEDDCGYLIILKFFRARYPGVARKGTTMC